MNEEPSEQRPASGTRQPSVPNKVVNLAYYRLKRSLQAEGFDLVTDQDGKVTLVIRHGRR